MKIGRAALLALSVLAGLTGTSVLAAAPDATACELRIETSKSSWIIQGYDPFGTALPLNEFDLTFINDGAGECRLRSAVDIGTEPFGLDQAAAARIVYTLADLSDDHDITPRTGMTLPNPTRPLLVVGPRSQKITRFRFVIDPAKIVSDGTFTQNALFQAKDESGATLASRQVILGLDVKPAALVGLAGSFHLSGGRALVDLGQLREGVVPLLLNLYVQSTRPYTIDVSSASSGKLKLGATEWAVPYQIIIGERTLSLSGDAQYLSPTGTAMVRQSLPLGFAVGTTSALRAGRYSDVITISIAPQ